MKMLDLYNRVIETTGLDVLTLESIQAAVANCMADLTSRGYKCFKEVNYLDMLAEDQEYIKECKILEKEIDEKKLNILYEDETSLKIRLPKDVRKTLYCKLYFARQACKATRYSVSNPRIDQKYINGKFQTEIDKNSLGIFYTKNDIIHMQWRRELGPIVNMQFGYYMRLQAPPPVIGVDDVAAIADIEIDIRPEFEDALVFYAAFFYYSRYQRELDKIELYQNQYKYYVEDIIHELSYEDDYFEEDAVITVDEEGGNE